MIEFVSRWLAAEQAEITNQRTDKNDKINSVSSVGASKRDFGRFSPATDFAPLDEDIIRTTVTRNTSGEIQARLDHRHLMAEAPDATLLHHRLVRDWAAILAAKESQRQAVERTA